MYWSLGRCPRQRSHCNPEVLIAKVLVPRSDCTHLNFHEAAVLKVTQQQSELQMRCRCVVERLVQRSVTSCGTLQQGDYLG